MKSYVVVTVEGGMVQSTDTYQGDEPGVYDPVVIDWDRVNFKTAGTPEEAAEALREFEAAALGLPEDWFVRDNIRQTVRHESDKLFPVDP